MRHSASMSLVQLGEKVYTRFITFRAMVISQAHKIMHSIMIKM